MKVCITCKSKNVITYRAGSFKWGRKLLLALVFLPLGLLAGNRKKIARCLSCKNEWVL